jgi:lipid A oxidase
MRFERGRLKPDTTYSRCRPPLARASARRLDSEWLARSGAHAIEHDRSDAIGQGTQLDLADAEYRGESFKSPQYYSLRGTWISKAHPWLGIEGEWIHAKVYAEVDGNVHARGTLRGATLDATVPLSSIVQRLSMSHGLNFILANVALRHGLGAEGPGGMHRIVAVVRAGAGPTMPHAESQINGVYVEQYESGGLGVQAGGGLEFSLWHGLGALAEYKFTTASPVIEGVRRRGQDSVAHSPLRVWIEVRFLTFRISS